MGFGELVRSARLGARMTQEQLAEKSGVSVRTIVELERDQVRRPRRDTIRRLADACGLTGAERSAFESAAVAAYWRNREATVDPAPAQLPPDVLGFAGRAAELAWLSRTATAPMIVTLSGMAGVGKTSLAVHWAHLIADQFPDGQLYLNLRGYDPRAPAMAPAEAVRAFLDALAVPPARIPAGLDAQVGLYRSLMAGRRMLVLLDNARDADQVRPLLPGGSTSVVVVTSRDDLPGLVAGSGARPYSVDILTGDAARELLRNRLGEERLAAEPDAVREIIDRCGGLPLALAVIAARAATAASLASLALELTGLDPLAGNDPATDVRAVFDCSYRALTAPAARLFRLLGLHPGPAVAEPAVASLAGSTSPLVELTQAHLLTRVGVGRYAFHDLLRAYAAELAGTDDEADRARRRMLDHYLHTAHAADRLVIPSRDSIDIGPIPPGVVTPKFTERAEAVAWFAVEHPVLVAVTRQAGPAYAWRLAFVTLEYLDRWGHWSDQITVHEMALAAGVADPGSLALTLRGLGRGYGRLGRLDDAQAVLERAADLFRTVGSLPGEARTHLSLAGLAERRGSYRRALDHAQRALDLFRAAGRPIGAGNSLNSVGWYHARLGEYAIAVASCREALAILEPTGDRYGLAGTWDSLGFAYHHLAEYRPAMACYERAIELHRGNGDRHNEAGALTRLGDTHQAVGDPARAADCWQRALAIRDELAGPDTHARTTSA